MQGDTVPAAVRRLADQLRAAQAASPPSLLRRMRDDPALYRRMCDEARRQAPQRYPHLFDPDVLQRLSSEDVVLGNGEDAETVQPVKRTRTRRPSVASVIRQMQRVGVEVAGCSINPRDGTVMVLTGKPVGMKADDDRNEWDTVQ